MRRFTAVTRGLMALALVVSASLANAATVYQENYQRERSFPLHPEVDLLGIGGMEAGSDGGGATPPALPILTGNSAAAQIVSTGVAYPLNEVTGTAISTDALLDLGQPFTATGRFGPLSIMPINVPANGLVAMLLHNLGTRYFISASVFVHRVGPTAYPSLNIIEYTPGLPIVGRSVSLAGVPVDTTGFELDIVIDGAADTAAARLKIGSLTYETAALPLQPNALAVQQPDRLSQLLGTENQWGAGNAAAVDFRGFRVTADVVQAKIDVKPGDPSNVVARNSRSPVPLAIFSSATFDATTVVPETIALAGAPVASARGHGRGCVSIDVNRDRRADLLCAMTTALIDAPDGESMVVMTARTTGGRTVVGQDRIRMTP